MNLSNMRRQHNALGHLSAHLRKAMHNIATDIEARECAHIIAKMTGVLTMHLAVEDKSLYPRLAASNDERVAKTARAFEREMGSLSSVYSEYAQKWVSGSDIFASAEQFRIETELVLNALEKRISRENDELYPLAEQLVAVAR